MSHFGKTLTALSIAAALGVAATPAAMAFPVASETGPELVTNGGFETGDFTGWTVNASLFTGVDGAAAHSGNFGAFLGDVGTPGTISQDIATVAWGFYNIHVWLRSDGLTPNSFEISWGGTTVYSATDLGPFDYTEIIIDPQGAGFVTELEFAFRNDNGFLEMDDISVRQIPEPISLALFGAGLLGLGWARRKAA